VARAEEDSRHRFRKRNSEASLLRLNFELSYPPFRYPDPGEEDYESIATTYIHEKQTKGQRIRGVPLQNERPQDYPTEEIQNKAVQSANVVEATWKCYSFGPEMFTSHDTPNLSVSMPNVSPHGAFSSGMPMVPPAESFS